MACVPGIRSRGRSTEARRGSSSAPRPWPILQSAAELVQADGVPRVAVAVDVRGGLAVGQGWAADQDGYDLDTALWELSDAGVTTYEVTAIDRDGLLHGPDLELCHKVMDMNVGAVIASAGVASVEDLRAARRSGCAGAIVGRALYDGRLTLEAALAV